MTDLTREVDFWTLGYLHAMRGKPPVTGYRYDDEIAYMQGRRAAEIDRDRPAVANRSR